MSSSPRRRHRGALQRSAPLRPPRLRRSAAELEQRIRCFGHLGPEPLGNGFDGAGLAQRARRQGDADQGGAARPARRRRARQHLCLRERSTAPGSRRGGSPARSRASAPSGSPPRSATCSSARSRPADRRLRDYVQASGELGYFQHHWAVYGKEGEPCPGCDCGERRPAHRPGRPLDVLLRQAPALRIDSCAMPTLIRLALLLLLLAARRRAPTASSPAPRMCR